MRNALKNIIKIRVDLGKKAEPKGSKRGSGISLVWVYKKIAATNMIRPYIISEYLYKFDPLKLK